jgi:hypothetical protein
MLLGASVSGARAGFESWSAEVKDDPFSGGQSVMVTYMSSLRSGVLIFCDSTKDGLRVRAIPGFEFNSVLDAAKPTMEFAIDGKRVGYASASTGTVGENLAASEADLPAGLAANFIRAFMNAHRQVAVKDGISDRPLLLSASGSTRSGKALFACMQKQPSWLPQ